MPPTINQDLHQKNFSFLTLVEKSRTLINVELSITQTQLLALQGVNLHLVRHEISPEALNIETVMA